MSEKIIKCRKKLRWLNESYIIALMAGSGNILALLIGLHILLDSTPGLIYNILVFLSGILFCFGFLLMKIREYTKYDLILLMAENGAKVIYDVAGKQIEIEEMDDIKCYAGNQSLNVEFNFDNNIVYLLNKE